ncbi:MAG: response regulator transcription factor [Bacteroidota bacterium]
MIKLAIADDHQVIIDGMESIFSNHESIEFVGGAANGKILLGLIEGQEVDVILMDINMPVMDGIDCTKHLHDYYPEIKVIALTMYDEPRLAKRMVKNGAIGFLLKNSSKSKIIEAITTVYNGGTYYDQAIMQAFLNLKSNGNSSSFSKLDQMTARELEVVKCICDELTGAEIGERLHISPHTVESHRANIFTKLGISNTAGLVKWAIKNGVVEV